MSSDQSSGKKKNSFTIVSSDATSGHGGYGMGTITLENMSSVIVDPAENDAYVDMDAMHARSKIERRVKYIKEREEVAENGKLYWIVWVNVEKNEDGPYYAGVTGCELLVDKSIKRAYKSMPEHVTNMEKSLKGKIVLEHMDEKSKNILRDYLRDFDPDMWENSSDELKEVLPE